MNMENRQTKGVNPYLPSFEYIPDGEPRVFDGRVYLYGSHDRFHGAHFCLNDYVCWSAPVNDPGDWRYEGVIFRKDQDPRNRDNSALTPPPTAGYGITKRVPGDLNPPGIHAMWAPDVTQGPDGRYYLYYCLDVLPEIGVAVCDEPAGAYAFLGLVRHPDGTPLGRKEGDPFQFDPGVYVEENGEVYLYSGNAPRRKDQPFPGHMSQVMKLEKDMLTLREAPHKLLPDIFESDGTGFEGHEFFEASSIRKIGDRYILVYSSVQSHELCWAESAYPDRDYRFGGTLVDIGDVFLNGRTEDQAIAPLGNTHGGIAFLDGAWYVFYHRQTNCTQYSRQACAERLSMDGEGRFLQSEITSCGLHGGPLEASGSWPARIACILTRNGKAYFSHPLRMNPADPYCTQDVPDCEPTDERTRQDAQVPFQYIANMTDGCTAGFRYFRFRAVRAVTLSLRGTAHGTIVLSTEEGEAGRKSIALDSGEWTKVRVPISAEDGVHTFFVSYQGDGAMDFQQMEFE